VATVDHHIPDVDTNAKLDPSFLRDLDISLDHAPLNIDGTTYRVHNAVELSQQPISGVLDNPPTVLRDLGIDERTQMVLKPGVRSLFVHTGQSAVAGHIGREDGRQSTLDPVLPRTCHGTALPIALYTEVWAGGMVRRGY